MFARFCSPVSLLLAVMVSLSPVLSCYAYADESATDQGVADAYSQEAQEDPDSRGDGARSSGADVDGESAASGADGSAAGEGRFPDDGASAGAGETAQEIDGGLAGGPDDSFGGFGDDLSLLDDGIMPLGLTEVGYLDKIYFALGANNSGGSESFKPYSVSWSAIKGTIHWVASKIYVNVASIAETLSTVSSNVSRQVNYLQAIDTATKYHRSEFTSAWGYGYGGTAVINSNSPAGWLQKLKEYNVNEYYDGYTYSTAKYLAFIFREMEQAETLSKKQWGYGYGDTAVFYSNSPAGWLQKLKEYNVNEYYDGYTYSTAKYLAFIFREMERANAKLNYNGSLVGGETGDYTAARLLARIHNAVYGNITYAETGVTAVRSPVDVLGYISNLIFYGNNDISMIAGRNLYHGGLNGADDADQYFSTARLLARLYNANVQEVTLHETGTTSYRSTAGLLGYIANLSYDTQYSDGVLLETLVSGKRSLADLMLYSANLSYLSNRKLDDLYSQLSDEKNLLYGIVSNLSGIGSSLDSVVDLLVGLQETLTEWGTRWDVQDRLIVEWAKQWGDVKGSSWSESEKLSLLAKLDGISNRLSVMAAKDVVDTLVGDLDFTRLAALSAEVEGAISDAFPFCIPAVAKQVLGLLAAEGSPPVWEFDIAGEPLVCDFAPFQPVADVAGWVARICFTLSLLFNTRKFVYMGGGAVSQ
jgi:hypothetical protein